MFNKRKFSREFKSSWEGQETRFSFPLISRQDVHANWPVLIIPTLALAALPTSFLFILAHYWNRLSITSAILHVLICIIPITYGFLFVWRKVWRVFFCSREIVMTAERLTIIDTVFGVSSTQVDLAKESLPTLRRIQGKVTHLPGICDQKLVIDHNGRDFEIVGHVRREEIDAIETAYLAMLGIPRPSRFRPRFFTGTM